MAHFLNNGNTGTHTFEATLTFTPYLWQEAYMVPTVLLNIAYLYIINGTLNIRLCNC